MVAEGIGAGLTVGGSLLLLVLDDVFGAVGTVDFAVVVDGAVVDHAMVFDDRGAGGRRRGGSGNDHVELREDNLGLVADAKVVVGEVDTRVQ